MSVRANLVDSAFEFELVGSRYSYDCMYYDIIYTNYFIKIHETRSIHEQFTHQNPPAVATLPELSSALGGCSSSTVYRKLKQLDDLVSYSHRGKYYALLECAEFDANGLWFYQDICFSRHGTLRHCAQAFVEASYRPRELNALLRVRTMDILAELVRKQQLTRIRFEGRSIYGSVDSAKQKQQMGARRIQQQATTMLAFMETDSLPLVEMALFFSVLHEKHRRLFAGLLSLCLGQGGDQRVAALLGLNRKTIRRGRRELSLGKVDLHRIRKPGGGRPSIQKKPLDRKATS